MEISYINIELLLIILSMVLLSDQGTNILKGVDKKELLFIIFHVL
jgi:hypothetical protein